MKITKLLYLAIKGKPIILVMMGTIVKVRLRVKLLLVSNVFIRRRFIWFFFCTAQKRWLPQLIQVDS